MCISQVVYYFVGCEIKPTHTHTHTWYFTIYKEFYHFCSSDPHNDARREDGHYMIIPVSFNWHKIIRMPSLFSLFLFSPIMKRSPGLLGYPSSLLFNISNMVLLQGPCQTTVYQTSWLIPSSTLLRTHSFHFLL